MSKMMHFANSKDGSRRNVSLRGPKVAMKVVVEGPRRGVEGIDRYDDIRKRAPAPEEMRSGNEEDETNLTSMRRWDYREDERQEISPAEGGVEWYRVAGKSRLGGRFSGRALTIGSDLSSCAGEGPRERETASGWRASGKSQVVSL